jgi:ferredoxin
MKIKIISERCIACGLCHNYAPDIFDYYDDGIVKFNDSEKLEKQVTEQENIILAVQKCPTAALQVEKIQIR